MESDSKDNLIQRLNSDLIDSVEKIKAKDGVVDDEGFLLPVENIFIVDHLRDKNYVLENDNAEKAGIIMDQSAKLAEKDAKLAEKDAKLAEEKELNAKLQKKINELLDK